MPINPPAMRAPGRVLKNRCKYSRHNILPLPRSRNKITQTIDREGWKGIFKTKELNMGVAEKFYFCCLMSLPLTSIAASTNRSVGGGVRNEAVRRLGRQDATTAVKAPVADRTGNTREKLVVCLTGGGAVSN